MMMYIRAEREGEFGLHLYCCKKMIPYFFADGHWNYARDGIVYLYSMERMPDKLLNKFMDRDGDLVDEIEEYVRMIMINTDVHLIFDRHKTGSIKSDTSNARFGTFRRCHQLSLDRKLPPKDMVLSSSSTKENLIELISSKLCTRFESSNSRRCLLLHLKVLFQSRLKMESGSREGILPRTLTKLIMLFHSM